MADKPHPLSPGVRLADLNRQGFMRGRKTRTPKEPPPIVACDACMNWHRKGKHTATHEERAANIAAEKARQDARAASAADVVSAGECLTCQGDGVIRDGETDDLRKCLNCNGTGEQ